MTDIFVNVATLTKWLDDSNPPGLHEDSMRVLKLWKRLWTSRRTSCR